MHFLQYSPDSLQHQGNYTHAEHQTHDVRDPHQVYANPPNHVIIRVATIVGPQIVGYKELSATSNVGIEVRHFPIQRTHLIHPFIQISQSIFTHHKLSVEIQFTSFAVFTFDLGALAARLSPLVGTLN